MDVDTAGCCREGAVVGVGRRAKGGGPRVPYTPASTGRLEVDVLLIVNGLEGAEGEVTAARPRPRPVGPPDLFIGLVDLSFPPISLTWAADRLGAGTVADLLPTGLCPIPSPCSVAILLARPTRLSKSLTSLVCCTTNICKVFIVPSSAVLRDSEADENKSAASRYFSRAASSVVREGEGLESSREASADKAWA